MPALNQGEFLNYVFKEALHREEQQDARYSSLSKTLGDARLKAMFNDFARSSREHLKQLKAVMNNLNIENS